MLHAPPTACFLAVSPLLKVNIRTKLLITGTTTVACDHCKTLAEITALYRNTPSVNGCHEHFFPFSKRIHYWNSFILTKTSFGILPFNLLVSLPVTPNASFSSNASHASCLHHEAPQLRRFVPASHCGGQGSRPGQYKLHF